MPEKYKDAHPDVLCLDTIELDDLLGRSEFTPRFVTEDSRQRRKMLRAEMARKRVEETFTGAQDKFLASLDMRLNIYPARESDLKRAEELTLRTNQLNTTGRTYSYEELDDFRKLDDYNLWVARLEDRYGTYGTIGLTLIEKSHDTWWIRLLLMSCRVMNCGIGGAMINHIRNQARNAKVRLLADMVENRRNRMMYMTYKFNHFREIGRVGDLIILENDLSQIHSFPDYLNIATRT